MMRFILYYENRARGTRFGSYEVVATSAEQAAQWLMDNHPRRTGSADTICVCGPCHFEQLATEKRFRNRLLGTEERNSRANNGRRGEHSARDKRRDKSITSQASKRQQFASVLGLSEDFTANDLKKAYRLAAGRNHPDKVSGLDVVFQKLAEKRMKEINQAYEYLRKQPGW